jgi:hypothetical protein
MSVDLAVWEGQQPSSDEAARETFAKLYEQYLKAAEDTELGAGIAQYVSALLTRYPTETERDTGPIDVSGWADGVMTDTLARYPDVTKLDGKLDQSPWTNSPMTNNARGPMVYLSISPSDAAADVRAFAIATARSNGLVCFNPQTGELAA